MLVLSRKPHEDILVGKGITIRVLAISGKTVRLGITCPKEIPIRRGEVEPKRQLETNAKGPSATDLVAPCAVASTGRPRSKRSGSLLTLSARL
jgi:carbon storage regulator